MVKTKICKCGHEIIDIPDFKGLYCYDYCCHCCPDAKKSPCQKEIRDGGVIENLFNLQNKQTKQTRQ